MRIIQKYPKQSEAYPKNLTALLYRKQDWKAVAWGWDAYKTFTGKRPNEQQDYLYIDKYVITTLSTSQFHWTACYVLFCPTLGVRRHTLCTLCHSRLASFAVALVCITFFSSCAAVPLLAQQMQTRSMVVYLSAFLVIWPHRFKLALASASDCHAMVPAQQEQAVQAYNGLPFNLTPEQVIGDYLRFLKDFAMEKLQVSWGSFSPDDVTWALSVPAGWTYAAKQIIATSSSCCWYC